MNDDCNYGNGGGYSDFSILGKKKTLEGGQTGIVLTSGACFFRLCVCFQPFHCKPPVQINSF